MIQKKSIFFLSVLCLSAVLYPFVDTAAKPFSIIKKKENSNVVRVKLVDFPSGDSTYADLNLDIFISNPASQARWVLIPYSLSSGNYLSKIDSFTEFKSPQGRLGRFFGSADFQAVYLPAKGKLTIQGLPIQCGKQGCSKEQLFRFEVLFASSFTIDGKPAETWFSDSPLWPNQAEMDFRQAHLTKSHDRQEEEQGILSLGNRVEVRPVTFQIKQKMADKR